MSYLSNIKEIDRGYVTFGGGAKGGKITGKGTLKTGKLDFEDVYFVLLKVPRKNNMYSVDIKNIVPKESLTCLVAKATLDKSMLWHWRLGHVNFKTINKLVKENLVIGLPTKRFENDQTCVACLKGKQHKDSCTNSNDFVGTEESIGAGHSSKETGLLSNDEPQPASELGLERRMLKYKCFTGSLKYLFVSPTFTTAPLEATHVDFFGDETKVDMSNITTTYPVPSTLNTRIYKDHSLDHVINDVQSCVLTRRMTKTTNEQGFISVVYEGKTHEDLHTCLFSCFLSQEEPKKVIQALKDPSWIESMQEELLQFKLQ
ncbi:putative ribonuclease H-like domain-containing protein [Tanacetum coccineum]